MAADLTPAVEQLGKALDDAKLKIKKFDPDKQRPIYPGVGSSISVERFAKNLQAGLGAQITKYKHIFECLYDLPRLGEIVEEYAKVNKLIPSQIEVEVPDYYQNLTLNLDASHPGRDLKFFLTTPKEIISDISGTVYLKTMGIADEQAVTAARQVIPEYRPRDEAGIVASETIKDEQLQIFNSYIPPKWMDYDEPLPDKLPRLFERLVKHLFPSEKEREYFYCWVWASLFDRAFVYLILCGAGATGKNRLKLVLRALHGPLNTVDGKKSTLTERFNSQLAENTLAWFDELRSDLDMENVMKEVQNDSIAIEKKGVDATRSTKIYSSIIISNNKPRDNYIAFDARKFVPLRISNRRLDSVMSPEEITELTNKVERWDHADYDLKFIAQIGRWIEKHGRKKKWMDRMLEYKGPMFYKLAHTSMSRWQKKAASLILDGSLRSHNKVKYDANKGYLWSALSEVAAKKHGDRSLQFPDFSTVQNFFDIFVDANGKETFKTEVIEDSVMGDFWVKLIFREAKIISEAEAMKEVLEDDEEEDEEEEYDL